MNKRERELKKLFQKWQKEIVFAEKGKRGQFVPDGIICPKIYESIPIKVLFMLRDPHDVDGFYSERGICDELMESSNSGKTWYPIASWARTLTMDNVEFKTVAQIKAELPEDVDEIDGVRKYFKRVSVMNLKKASGESRASKIEEYAELSNQFILNEIQIIDPTVIVACGKDVYKSLAKTIFGIEDVPYYEKIEFNERMKTWGHYFDAKKCLNSENSVYVVEYRHPACYTSTGSQEEHYENMKKIYSLIKNK